MRVLLLLARCRYCRNRVRYLFSPWFGWQQFGIQLRRRLRALPDDHRLHGPGCYDAATPVRWRDRVRAS